MKVFTIHNHIEQAGDFCFGIEGELAFPAEVVCDNRNCGCDRAFGGLNSHRASTAIIVRDVDLSVGELVDAYLGYLESAGWAKAIRSADGEAGVRQHAVDMVLAVCDIADEYPVGTVLRVSYDRAVDDWSLRAA